MLWILIWSRSFASDGEGRFVALSVNDEPNRRTTPI